MYINRVMEKRILELARFFPIVMVYGPRQVGKTTMLQKVCTEFMENMNYVTFDNVVLRELARKDPELFLQRYQPPVLIDEFQYVPELLPYIKMRVDESQKNGQYFLTGSQLFTMMSKVSESLAGRVGILELFSLSNAELLGYRNEAFLPHKDFFSYRNLQQRDVNVVFDNIFRGSMPRMAVNPELSPEDFYSSYVKTYLERDIRDIINLKNESKFIRFLSCLALRTGQELVVAELAKEVEVDNKTISSWISVLESTGIIFLLQPYFNNALKRLIKRPKLYFMDTGLACYLSMWNNPRILELSPMAGNIFETFVVSEIIKSYVNNGMDPHRYLYYYRDTLQREIDLLILRDNVLYPIEIKKSTDPGEKAVKNFAVLKATNCEIGIGSVICMAPCVMPLNRENNLVPLDEI